MSEAMDSTATSLWGLQQTVWPLATSWTLTKFHFEIWFAWTWLHSKTCYTLHRMRHHQEPNPFAAAYFRPWTTVLHDV